MEAFQIAIPNLTFRESNRIDAQTLDYWHTIDRLPDNDPDFGIEAAMTCRENRPMDLIGKVYIVELIGRPIGFVGLYEDYMRQTPIRSIRRYLAPEYRGLGYGTELLRITEKLADKEGLTEIFSVTHKMNTRAQRTLERSGWQLIRKTGQKFFYRRSLMNFRAR